jgi:hypothetical protein
MIRRLEMPNLPKTVDVRKAEFKEVWGNKFDYSLFTEPTGRHGRIEVICREHGIFSVTIGNHLNGTGCRDCSNEKQSRDKTIYTEEERKQKGREYYNRVKKTKEFWEKRRKYHHHKKSSDINYVLVRRLRKRLYDALKSAKKSSSALKLLGCSIEELKKHLESQFTEGMSWENHGYYGWHIDHIKPCYAFDLTDPEEQKKCFHWTNLQPLWWWENLEKGARY